MSNQTIPITLQSNPVPVGITAANIDQLLTVIAQYMSASISGDVSFFYQTAADPTQFVTSLIYNTNQNVFKGWDTGTGKYLPITQFQTGDVKNSFVGGDEVSYGWIVLDGRLKSAITGLSQNQQAVMNQLFLSDYIPNVAPLQNLSGLPNAGTFSAISLPDVQPPQNQIANLAFSPQYSASESQALAQNTETLRGAAKTINDGAKLIRDTSEAVLEALRGGSTSERLYSKVFIGYP